MAELNFTCRNCGSHRAQNQGDGMVRCTNCGVQTPANSIAENPLAKGSPATTYKPPAWRKWLYLPMIAILGLSGFYIVQSYRSGSLGMQIPNVFHPNGENYTWTGNDQGVYAGKEGRGKCLLLAPAGRTQVGPLRQATALTLFFTVCPITMSCIPRS